MLTIIACALLLTNFVQCSSADTPGCNTNLDDILIRWYSRPLGQPSETRKGLTNLSDAYKIEIVNQSVPILCQNSLKNLDHLFELDLSHNGILELQPGAFSGVPKLSDLHLDGNALEEIKTGVFNDIPITILRLQNNYIRVIGRDAFDDMPRLRILNLANNSINMVNSDWFKNTPMVHQLNLEDNAITSLGPHAFKHLQGKQIIYDIPAILNIDLSNNRIVSIDPKAFDGLGELGRLSLDGNLLEKLHEDTFSELKTIKSVSLMYNRFTCFPIHVHHILKAEVTYLENNPWNCTCLTKLSGQVKRKRLNVHINYEVIKCKIDVLSAIVRDTLAEYDN